MSLTTRRGFLGTTAGALLAQPGRAARALPNIVFILADDLGYADLSCYGRRDYTTPHIDRLAKEGVRFTQFYANAPVCSPTRTALITGRYQYRLPLGLEEPLAGPQRDRGLPPDHATLPSLLRAEGYQTALVGKWHLGYPPKYGPLQSGYDRFWGFRGPGLDYFAHTYGDPPAADLWANDTPIERPGYITDLLGDKALELIRHYAASRKPFFLSLHFSAPHWPWEPPGGEAEARTVRSLFHADGGSQDIYRRMVQRMDDQVGRVMAELRKSGADRNTIVIFTSDNGGERYSDTWPFTGRKTELLEGGVRVPAIVRWPARIKPGRVCEQVSITMDWLPTLLAQSGDGRNGDRYLSDGIDLSPQMLEGRPAVPRTLYWRYRYAAQRSVRDGNWKWLKIGDNSFLFDLASDPQERANRKAQHPDIAARLEQQWQQWNQSMLPEDPTATAHGFRPNQLADHYVNPLK